MFGLRWLMLPGLCLCVSIFSSDSGFRLPCLCFERKRQFDLRRRYGQDGDRCNDQDWTATAGYRSYPDGKFVFVALGDDDTIQMFDTKSRNDAGELPSGPDPEQFSLDPAGKFLYVANENDAMVTVIDMEKRTAIGQVTVGTEPEGMAVSPDSKEVICTSETTSMVHFIDPASREITGNLLVGSRPRFSAFKSDGSELWVTSEIGGSLAIIDPATRQLKQTVTFEIPGLRSEASSRSASTLPRTGSSASSISGLPIGWPSSMAPLTPS